MGQTTTVEIEVPTELIRQLGGHINSLNEAEQRRLEAAPYRHSPQAQFVLEEMLLRRRNLPELLDVEDVEVDERGRVEVVESSGLLDR